MVCIIISVYKKGASKEASANSNARIRRRWANAPMMPTRNIIKKSVGVGVIQKNGINKHEKNKPENPCHASVIKDDVSLLTNLVDKKYKAKKMQKLAPRSLPNGMCQIQVEL